MNDSLKSVLVDTNIWIDYYLGYRAGHETARKLLIKANEADIQLLHAVSSTKDVFFLVGMDFKRATRQEHDGSLTDSEALAAQEVAWACVENMQNISTAVGCDQSDVWLAQKQRRLHGDYEDNLIIAAALRAKASLLVTNDEQLLKHCPVAALSAADALKLLS